MPPSVMFSEKQSAGDRPSSRRSVPGARRPSSKRRYHLHRGRGSAPAISIATTATTRASRSTGILCFGRSWFCPCRGPRWWLLLWTLVGLVAMQHILSALKVRGMARQADSQDTVFVARPQPPPPPPPRQALSPGAASVSVSSGGVRGDGGGGGGWPGGRSIRGGGSGVELKDSDVVQLVTTGLAPPSQPDVSENDRGTSYIYNI